MSQWLLYYMRKNANAILMMTTTIVIPHLVHVLVVVKIPRRYDNLPLQAQCVETGN